jgi:hypothetical protein
MQWVSRVEVSGELGYELSDGDLLDITVVELSQRPAADRDALTPDTAVELTIPTREQPVRRIPVRVWLTPAGVELAARESAAMADARRRAEEEEKQVNKLELTLLNCGVSVAEDATFGALEHLKREVGPTIDIDVLARALECTRRYCALTAALKAAADD